MSEFNKDEINVLNSMKETREQKSLKNLLSRKSFDSRELDELMCNYDY